MIRQGKKEDLPEMASLIFVILRDMELQFIEKFGEEQTRTWLLEAMAQPTYRYHPSRALVKEIDGVVAGVAFGYPNEAEEIIDRPFTEVLKQAGIENERLFTDSEVFPDEWYLDTICVHEAYRGQGIGRELFANLPDFVRQSGKSRIGLCVDDANPKARHLYNQLGFQPVGEQMLGTHHYLHMQKELVN